MKKLFALLFMATLTFSCSSDGEIGPQGPQGPQGPPGEPGLGGVGYTFEETVTFDYFPADNLYGVVVRIPENAVTINPDADAVLVYRLEVVDANDGGEIDTWSLIPQNFFLDEGTIQYVYNHTSLDVELLIDGNFNLSNLDPGFTDGQTFRIVVVPSDFLPASGVDVSDYDAVMQALKIQDRNIPKLELQK